MEHRFSNVIRDILSKNFGKNVQDIFEQSLLIQYINQKTKSADTGSKSRGSFANLYAIYTLVEDYIQNDFHETGTYSLYEGALFSVLLQRQRSLPFGDKLQNHALNNRLNSEYQKFFPQSELIPILRDLTTNRYWINENLLKVVINGTIFNLGESIIEIINAYIEAKQGAFHRFIKTCKELQIVTNEDPEKIENFIKQLLSPDTDARLFEIVSYSILKAHYAEQNIIWGFDSDNLQTESLQLYKTGRTNANDGGIDFVMKPLGRFFQVTETLDFKKYFLDIDKIEKYPITFVVKTEESEEIMKEKLRSNAMKLYGVELIVNKYIACIEELINLPKLLQYCKNVDLQQILAEVILQSKVEFNQED